MRSSRNRRIANRRQRHSVISVEMLEQRLVFSTLTVNTLLDNTTADSVLTLREAVMLIQNSGNASAALGRSLTSGEQAEVDVAGGYSANTVVFDNALADGTITFASQIQFTASMTIDGGNNRITLSGGGTPGNVRAFSLPGAADLTLNNLTLQNFGQIGSDGSPAGGEATGGAIWGYGAHVTINGCTFTNNLVQGGDGTGNSVHIAGNGQGGAIWIYNGELDITNSTFNGNIARSGIGAGGGGEGGAIFIYDSTLNITNSTFTGNVAEGNFLFSASAGGAIYAYDTNTRIDFATISDNQAKVHARGIFFHGNGNLLITNSILSQATVNSLLDLGVYGSGTVAGSNNLIGSTNAPEMGVISTGDPKLGPLASNGGRTQTMALQAGSPAFDAAGATVPTTDQRGRPRIAGAHADLGAFEADAVPPTMTIGDADGSITVWNYDGSERLTIDNPFPTSPTARRIATGDLTGDGTLDVIVASGPGRRAQVIAYDGADGVQLAAFSPFEAWAGAVFVASGDIDHDGVADIIAATGSTRWSKARVRVFSGADQSLISEFVAFNAASTLRIATADLDGDGYAEIIATRGGGSAAKVRVFDGQSIAADTRTIASEFIAYENWTGGCFLATGDVNNDGQTDIIVSQASGRRPYVSVFNGDDKSLQTRFRVSAFNGAPIASHDRNGDGYDDIFVVTRSGSRNIVEAFSGADNAILDTLDSDIHGRMFIA